MECVVRQMATGDRAIWARMRAALWPEETVEAHTTSVDDALRSEEVWGFVAETGDGSPIAFAEVSVRKYANGCETAPVPFLEGIWVDDAWRRRGVGARLLRHVEPFLSARGFTELGSDALLDNLVSHASHRGWGFAETERVVYFRKPLAREG